MNSAPLQYTLWAQFGEPRLGEPRPHTLLLPAPQAYCLVFVPQACGERTRMWFKSIGGVFTTLATLHHWERVPYIGSVLWAGQADPHGEPCVWVHTTTARVVWRMLTRSGSGYRWSTTLADALEYSRKHGWGTLYSHTLVDDLKHSQSAPEGLEGFTTESVS